MFVVYNFIYVFYDNQNGDKDMANTLFIFSHS